MKKKNWIMRAACGALAAAMLIGATIAYAEENDENVNSVIEEVQEDVGENDVPTEDVGGDVETPEEPTEPEPGTEETPEGPSDKPDKPNPDKPTEPEGPTPDEPEEPAEPTFELSVDERSTQTIRVGRTKTVRASVTPEGTAVEWESNKESVVKIDVSKNTLKAEITALKEGTAEITAKADNGMEIKFYVYAKAKDPADPTNPNNPPARPITRPGYSVGSVPTAPVATYKMPTNIPNNVSLTINSTLGTNTDKMLDALYSYDCYATFFVNPEKIYQKDNRVRRIIGQGHSVGITLTAKQADDAEKAIDVLEQANRDLTTVCGVPTRLISIEGGSKNLSKKVYKELDKAGYRIWDWDYYAETEDSKKAAEKLEDKMDTKGNIVVRISTDGKSTKMFTEVLGYMNYVQIPTSAIVSSDIPVCFAKKNK